MKIFDITGDSFTDEIENYDGTVLIDFFCGMVQALQNDVTRH